MSFETQIDQISTDDLEKLFEGAPEGTPNADTLKTGKQGLGTFRTGDEGDDIPFIDEKELDEPTADQIEADKKAAAEAEAEAKKKADEADKNKTKEQLEADQKAATEAEAKKKLEEETKKKEEEEAKDKPSPEQVNAILKNTVDYLVKSGQWAEWDGREDLEITEEVYADLVAKQDEFRLTQNFNELVDSTGAYGKAIISHIKNGGDPDQVIDIFKEQKALQQIDTSTEEGKLAMIEKYYKEVVGYKPAKVEKDLKRLVTEEGVEEEFGEIKELYDKHYKQRLAEADKEVEAKKQVEAGRKELFVKNIKSALDENTDLTPADKKALASSILDFKHDVGSGQKVNDFYIRFAEIQADPKQYIELVRFVMNPKGYKATIASKEATQAAKTTFNFVKGNATLTRTKNSNTDLNDTKGSPAYKGTDFSSFLK